MPNDSGGFEGQIAKLQPKRTKGLWPRLEALLLAAVWWFTCCCCYQCRKPFGFTKPNKKEDWSAHKEVKSCPAQLKVSTIDKRTIEVKITYAENAAMSTQLYEVDVFMFFLKDLEAVSTNFYHDLWQSTRMHTPKIPLAAMAAGDAPDSLSNLIKDRLLVIQYKQLVGNEHDAAVQQDIDQATDAVVQQLRLQGCMFRQSVRRAMKRVTSNLEGEPASTMASVEAHYVATHISSVIQQIAEVIHKMHLLCQPLEASEVPEAVREVWIMVDEYMLTEAEVCLIKLLETLDKTALHVGCCAISPAVSTRQHPSQADDAQDMPTCCLKCLSRSSLEAAQLCPHHAALGSGTFAQAEQCSRLDPAGECSDTTSPSCSSSSSSDEALSEQQSSTGAHASNSENVMHLHSGPGGDVVPDVQASRIPASAQQDCKADHAASGEAREAVCMPEAVRRLSLHSSASSLAPKPGDLQNPARSDDSSDSKYNGISRQAGPALGALDDTDFDRQALGLGSSQAQQAAAYTFLCDPRGVPQPKGSLAHDGCLDTISESPDEVQATSNMLMLIMKAKGLQKGELGCGHNSKAAGSAHDAAEQSSSLPTLANARQLIVDAVEHLQGEMRLRNYFESIIQDEDSNHNEVYTNRIKCLKHNARAAVVLKHQTLQQSFLLADVVGATVAGLAMCVAIGGIYLCYRFSRYQLNPLYVLITVVAYMMKDRIKEWGKRYLQPVCIKFGFEFPDRIVKVRDARGRRVGRCKEWTKVVGVDQVDARVLAMRHKDQLQEPKVQKTIKPERVMTYRKKMEVNWDRLDPRLQCVDGLDDIMRFDLQHFCRRMQPPHEPHYRICTDGRGRKYAEQVQCARVYHINIVLRIRTSTQNKVGNRPYKEKSMQIQRARVIMDQDGIKRLEATDDSVHLKSNRRALHRLSTPDWLADVHMPSMQFPRMQMPHMNFVGFGRRQADTRSSKNVLQEHVV